LRTVQYHEAAEGELLTQIAYLERRAQGLGRRFFEEVKRAERLIAQFPEAGEEVHPGIRKQPLRTFRYSLIYSVEREGPLILAIAHHSRRPGYWAGRVSTRDPDVGRG
jgi:plasmid stabilization system protein ParE